MRNALAFCSHIVVSYFLTHLSISTPSVAPAFASGVRFRLFTTFTPSVAPAPAFAFATSVGLAFTRAFVFTLALAKFLVVYTVTTFALALEVPGFE